MKAHIHIAHILDVGKSRTIQQDHLICGFLDEDKTWQFDVHGSLETNTSLSILSDGMGGTVSGEVASNLVVNNIKEYISDHFPQDGPGNIKGMLIDAVTKANDAVQKHVELHPADLNMGATVVVCLITDDVAHIVWVGDSRCYKQSGEKFKQLTKDHSLVQQLIEKGELDQSQARNHPKGNIITQSLSGKAFKADYLAASFKEGDTLVVCSDGLNSMVTDENIKHELLTLSPDLAVKQLVNKANIAGGFDNISIIIIKRPISLLDSKAKPFATKQKSKQKKDKKTAWVLGVVISLMSVLIIGLNIWQKPQNSFSESNVALSNSSSDLVKEATKSFDEYPDSGLGNQNFYIRLGTFSDSVTLKTHRRKILKLLPEEEKLSMMNADTFYELKTRYFSTRSEAQDFLTTYLSDKEGVIINAPYE